MEVTLKVTMILLRRWGIFSTWHYENGLYYYLRYRPEEEHQIWQWDHHEKTWFSHKHSQEEGLLWLSSEWSYPMPYEGSLIEFEMEHGNDF